MTHPPYNRWTIKQDECRVEIFRQGHGIDPLTFTRLLSVIRERFVKEVNVNWIYRTTNDQWEADVSVVCNTYSSARDLASSLPKLLCPACGSLHEFPHVSEAVSAAINPPETQKETP